MNWVETFLVTALRINRLFETRGSGFYLDCYYGPAALAARVREETPATLDALLAAVSELLTTLPQQNFAPRRRTYLEKQLGAMTSVLRWLAGAEDAFEAQVRAVLDLPLAPVPDAFFEESLRMFAASLPGQGSLRERYACWQARNKTNMDEARLAAVIHSGLAEARRRTKALTRLPDDEAVSVSFVRDKEYGAANWYQGGHASRMEFSLDKAHNLFTLLPLICHEGYPGHHVEHCLKEAELVSGKGYAELSLLIILSPQLVLTEGLAEKAFEVIFSFDDAARWMKEEVYQPMGLVHDDVDLATLFAAAVRNKPDQVMANMVHLFHEGRSYEDIVSYGLRYTLEDEALIRASAKLVTTSRFHQLYGLTYAYGKKLVERYVAQAGKGGFFALLRGQFTPSELAQVPPP